MIQGLIRLESFLTLPFCITCSLLKQQLKGGRYSFQGKWEAPASVRGIWTPVKRWSLMIHVG